jgi:hypothetical protein
VGGWRGPEGRVRTVFFFVSRGPIFHAEVTFPSVRTCIGARTRIVRFIVRSPSSYSTQAFSWHEIFFPPFFWRVPAATARPRRAGRAGPKHVQSKVEGVDGESEGGVRRGSLATQRRGGGNIDSRSVYSQSSSGRCRSVSGPGPVFFFLVELEGDDARQQQECRRPARECVRLCVRVCVMWAGAGAS